MFVIHALTSTDKMPSRPLLGEERDYIFASVVLYSQLRTFGLPKAGFILQVPEANVLGSSPTDTGYNVKHVFRKRIEDGDEQTWNDLSKDYERRGGGKLRSPKGLLLETDPLDHNEVLLRGSSKNGVVQILGVFMLEDRSGLPMRPDSEGLALREFAKNWGLPFVTLSNDKPPLVSWP